MQEEAPTPQPAQRDPQCSVLGGGPCMSLPPCPRQAPRHNVGVCLLFQFLRALARQVEDLVMQELLQVWGG